MAAGSRVGSAYYELNASDGKLKTALNNADRQIKSTGTNAERVFSGNMAKAAGAFGAAVKRAAVVGVAALGTGLGLAVTRAAQFEKAMLNVNSIAKLSTDDFESMKDQVKALSLQLPQSATTLAEGLYQIQSSGFAGAEGITVLKAAAKAASAGLTTTSSSASGLTAILNAYGLKADEAGRISDIMFKVVDRGVLTFDELSSEIGTTTAIAASLGVPFEEVAASLALMTRQGFNAAEATTSISAIMSSMLKPSAEAATLAADLGLEWDVGAVKAKGMVGVLNEMIEATGGDQEKMAVLLGDVRAIRGAFALAGEDGAALTKELGFMEKAGGATDTALSYQKQGLAYNLELLRNNLDAAAMAIGEALLPVLVPLLTKLSEWLSTNQELIGQIAAFAASGLESFVTAVGNLAAVAIDVGGAIAGWVQQNGPLLAQLGGLTSSVIVNGIKGLADSLLWLGSNDVTLALGIATAAVLGFVGVLSLLVAHPVIGALALLVTTIGLVSTAWQQNWLGMRDTLIEAWPAIRGALDSIYGGVQIFGRLVEGTVLSIILMWTELVGAAQRGAEVIVGAMASVPGPFQEDAKKAHAALVGLADGTQAETDRIQAQIDAMANAPLDHLPVWQLGVGGFSPALDRAANQGTTAAARLRGNVTRMMDLGSIPSTHGANAGARYGSGLGGQYRYVGGKAAGLASAARGPLDGSGDSSWTWGFRLGSNFAAGIDSSASAARSAAWGVAAAASAALRLSSPAKEGPLSQDASIWGRKLGTSFAGGLWASARDISRAALEAARAAVINPIASMGSLGAPSLASVMPSAVGAGAGFGGGSSVSVVFNYQPALSTASPIELENLRRLVTDGVTESLERRGRIDRATPHRY